MKRPVGGGEGEDEVVGIGKRRATLQAGGGQIAPCDRLARGLFNSPGKLDESLVDITRQKIDDRVSPQGPDRAPIPRVIKGLDGDAPQDGRPDTHAGWGCVAPSDPGEPPLSGPEGEESGRSGSVTSFLGFWLSPFTSTAREKKEL